MNKRGKLIVVEGLDGAGKRTQAEKLYNRIKEKGESVIKVSFPNYEKESSILVKKYLHGDFTNVFNNSDNITFVKQISTFYAVDRVASFIERTYDGKSLIEQLSEGTHIICDRYTTSNMLHQSGNLKNQYQLFDYLDWVIKFEFDDLQLPRPDLVLFLDVTPEISINNIKKRNEDTDIHENIRHFKRVYDLSLEIVKYCKWDLIDCSPNGTQLPIEDIHEIIAKRLQVLLPDEFSDL